jgi:putative transposase
VTWRGLVRCFVLFGIDLKTRRIAIAGISPAPNGAWMSRMGRNLTDVEVGFLNDTRYPVHDREPLFTEGFTGTLGDSGVRCVKPPPCSPNWNARAERFVRSVQSEYVGQIIPIGERRLRRAVREYAEHPHYERSTRPARTPVL